MVLPIIEVKGLTYTYPESESPSLKDVNFKAEAGEFVLVTGPSGCGKTTFCRALNGLIPNSYGGEFRGSVVVDGLSTTSTPVYELAQRVGLVFQNPENELFCTTVEREVAFGPENLALSREEIAMRVEEALSTVGILHLKEKSPEELSGGEQQKVAIAALLAMKPKILVLDEPTANLDPLSAKSILELMSRLNESGVTVVLVEHRLEMVSHMADRCIVFDGGRIVMDGSPEDVLYSDSVADLGIGIPKVVLVSKHLNRSRNGSLRCLTPDGLASYVRGFPV
ncbi:MAG: ABC transporter ATP-binding protein [Candidatus Verstraetearchaeota archaeon]|nr:ABC transporter ATP-binding protein [Candidatus Verstraetearchaeota archaeon]